MQPGVIPDFRREYQFLSNFWLVGVWLDGVLYRSVEHAYQAAKTLHPREREWVAGAPGPAAAKIIGGQVTLRPDWEEIKVQVMLDLLRQKFSRGSKLAEVLDSTGGALLVEVNTWRDRFWGVYKGEGLNWLGILLMQVRDENRERPANVPQPRRKKTGKI